MDFYSQTGKLALGSRLRRLSEKLAEDAAKIYALYGVALDPKWFPVFFVLSHQEKASITEIAQIIGHSHPSVSQIVKEMSKEGLTLTDKTVEDARINAVRLSDRGKQLVPQLEKQYVDVAQAVEELLSETQHDLWKAIEAIEFLLTNQSFFDRVQAVRKARERQHIEIIDYSPEFHDDFKRLNYEWIEKYFKLEEFDYQSLDHPDERILQPGGHIYMAVDNSEMSSEVVGTCALIKIDNDTYELAKMVVAERVRGKGIGWLLGQAAISKARDLGAKVICLESNTVLEPAINLYQKLGFRRVVGHASPYERCNIQMELSLVEQTSDRSPTGNG
ncbi:MAG: bifunctional helix-turn-helix transcriptional regulator/GNAT family N-acetyltransferase [Drouetiella hepatica Uher 2000/2452]|jgi:DNA-binding MarR family transcriptional regulator/N-acetylglutamate synthase-like GNAT family acetyltransferase|uniref:Bifunctional helix-turn-helix transcriptional regulator/GNAT family N-acetyltransferase n=1 Tax=Drouetiella hepatica Uher 2000/2452 TaxID=904376 RepID=A0A951Q896_9CYAN|nr:bifunctional helix-turn-helix transcriptional regulator/GNAT family N-acetyltransferase [Drouetiella hepatica Uher 2000/2452]